MHPSSRYDRNAVHWRHLAPCMAEAKARVMHHGSAADNFTAYFRHLHKEALLRPGFVCAESECGPRRK
eukprot:2403494-Pyramimonas_sp.AAC.2